MKIKSRATFHEKDGNKNRYAPRNSKNIWGMISWVAGSGPVVRIVGVGSSACLRTLPVVKRVRTTLKLFGSWDAPSAIAVLWGIISATKKRSIDNLRGVYGYREISCRVLCERPCREE